MDITIYTKDNCPNCTTAKNLLETNGLEYQESSFDNDPIRWAEFCAAYPEVRQMPQIFVNGVRIGGLAGLQAYLPDILAGRVA